MSARFVIIVIVIITILILWCVCFYRSNRYIDIREGISIEDKKMIETVANFEYTEMPLVSAVCVTRMRVPYLKRVVRDFFNQTYPNKELVIVYDSDDTETSDFASTLDPALPIVLVRNERKLKLGALRNLGIRAANGKCVTQWDDDDEYNPLRIESQLKVVQYFNYRKACCLSRWIIYDNQTNKRYISNHYAWEGSILSSKQLLLDNPYPEMSRGEDTVVISALKKKDQIILLNMPELYVYHLHWTNTWDRSHGKSLMSRSSPTIYDIPCRQQDIDFFNSNFKIVYINLDRSIETRNSIEKSARDARINIERFAAIDGTKLEHNGSKLSPGEQGCLASHKTLWKRFSRAQSPVLICEDDIVFDGNISRNLPRKLQYMKDKGLDWNILLLYAGVAADHENISWGDCYYKESHMQGYGVIEMGDQNTNIPHIPAGITSCIPTNSCYMVTPQACQWLVNTADEFRDSLPADVILSIVMKRYKSCYYIQGQINILRGAGDPSDIQKAGGYTWKGEGL